MSVHILHFADLHWCPEHAAEAEASLQVVIDTAREREVDLVAFAGDLFDRGLQASDRDALPKLLALMRALLDVAPVVAVRGTPTHDVAGAYEVLTGLRAEHDLTMLEPGVAYRLDKDGRVWGGPLGDLSDRLLILGCPEPGKDWVLAGKNGLSRDEAAQAVVDGMRAILLGLGGLRRNHPDLPSLMLYHGQVRGATMGAGQVVTGSALAIGAEDLALVGADYYALGDIHLAQQIGQLPAYYPGSAYPTDWGERDQKGCYLVEMAANNAGPSSGWGGAPFVADVERIPFPHPPRRKIVATAEKNLTSGHIELDTIVDDLGGSDTWLVIRARPEVLAEMTTDEWLRWLHAPDDTAGPGSRVTFEPIPTETVRAAEIAEAQHLRDKLVVLAQARSEERPADSILEKADALEAEARAEGIEGSGHHVRHRSLRLRGSIAIKKGLGVDEVVFDFDALDPGLVALVAPNGSGKTGLLSRLHPFPDMPPRGGALHEHFCLKDSASELIWSDERTGEMYRSLILIDPLLSTPKAEYHLYKRGGYSVPWIPMTEGRKEEYEEKIAAMWGSVDLYIRSAYITQRAPKGKPDLADAQVSERKALFLELGGLQRFEWYAARGKANADTTERGILTDQARADQMATDLAMGPAVEIERAAKASLLTTAKAAADDLLAKGQWHKSVVDDLAKQVAEQQRMSDRRAALDADSGRLAGEAVALGLQITKAEQAVTGRRAAAAVVQKAEDLERAKGVLNEERTKVATRCAEISTEHARALAAHGKAREELQAQQRVHERKEEGAQRRKDALLASIDRIAEGLAEPLTDLCPTCGQTLPAEKLAALRASREADGKTMREKQDQVLVVDADILDAQQAARTVADRIVKLAAPVAPPLPEFAQQAALEAVLIDLSKLDVSAARETVRIADAAAEQIKAARARRMQIDERRAEILTEYGQLAEQIDPTIATKHAEARMEHERLQRAWAEAHAKVAALEAEVKSLERQLADLERKRAEHVALTERLTASRAELSEWRYLERACGRDGIQALELDAMGPSVSAEATKLLQVAREAGAQTPFDSIRIETQRVAGRGAKTKVVEAFAIECHDTRDDSWTDLSMISGGESVWLRAAIYQAFGVLRAKSTGLRFDLLIMDEADGALDPEARIPYLRMLERGHADSGRRHTLIVTHSAEIRDAIRQRVEMRDLVVRERQEVVA